MRCYQDRCRSSAWSRFAGESTYKLHFDCLKCYRFFKMFVSAFKFVYKFQGEWCWSKRILLIDSNSENPLNFYWNSNYPFLGIGLLILFNLQEIFCNNIFLKFIFIRASEPFPNLTTNPTTYLMITNIPEGIKIVHACERFWIKMKQNSYVEHNAQSHPQQIYAD